MEKETSCQKKAGLQARANYKFRAKLGNKKKERQNTNIERTNVKKICDSTIMNQFNLIEIGKEIRRGMLTDLTMNEIVTRVCDRRIGCGLSKKIDLTKDKFT